MTGDLWALAVAILLAVIQLTLSSVLTLRQLVGTWVAGPRDEPREVSGVSGRIVRADRNLLEIFPQFVAARLLYVPAYVFAPPGLRPVCWLAAQIGIFMIVADLFV
jgi:uncharacterized MAPEG superfamily protein